MIKADDYTLKRFVVYLGVMIDETLQCKLLASVASSIVCVPAIRIVRNRMLATCEHESGQACSETMLVATTFHRLFGIDYEGHNGALESNSTLRSNSWPHGRTPGISLS